MKTEPSVYSIDDLKKDRKTCWDSIRNYQARNYMRDEMKVGDLVLIYHANADPPGVAGVARVCKESYADHTQFDQKSKYYDSKATKDAPRWMMVDVAFMGKFKHFVSLEALKADKRLQDMLVLKRGMRLSIQPVDAKHFDIVRKTGKGT